MLIVVEGGKPENPEKNPRSKDENQQQTQPTYDTGSRIWTWATLVGGERDHHSAIPAPQHNKSRNSLRELNQWLKLGQQKIQKQTDARGRQQLLIKESNSQRFNYSTLHV